MKILRKVGLVALGLAALVLVDVGYVALGMRASLTEARTRLREGVGLFANGSPGEARDSFRAALDAGNRADSLTAHPSFALASVLPGIGRDTEAIDAFAGAAQLSARAGLEAAGAAGAAGAERLGLLGALYHDGRVDFGALERAAPGLRRTAGLLQRANTYLREAPDPTLPPVNGALDDARSGATRAVQASANLVALADGLPQLLAQGSVRRYLLSFESPSEARGGGGLSSLYGVLEARDGRMRLADVASVANLGLEPAEAVSAPAWFEDRYAPWGSLWQWQQANLTGEFPVAAQVWLRMYEAARGERLDGVIAMDPLALGEFTTATGPLRAEGMDVDVDRSNADEVILHDSYIRFDGRRQAQEQYLARLIDQFWGRVSAGQLDPAALITALGRAVTGGHLKMYATDAQAASTVSELGVAGSFSSLGPNVQYVFHNNVGANKVDYFLRRSIATTVRLTQQGSARVITSATLTNLAPAGPRSDLLGPEVSGLPPGASRMFLNVVLSRGAEVDAYGVDGELKPTLLSDEAGYPAVWDIVVVPPGETVEVTVGYTVPNAYDASANAPKFDFVLFPQSTIRPDRFSLTVAAPYEFKIVDEDAVDGEVLRLSGELSEPKAIHVSLERI
jgi:hypothetical protein